MDGDAIRSVIGTIIHIARLRRVLLNAVGNVLISKTIIVVRPWVMGRRFPAVVANPPSLLVLKV